MSEHDTTNPRSDRRAASDGQPTAAERSARWWRRATITLLALGVGFPLAVRALGPVPHSFGAGEVISASEMNENFAHLQNAITNVEGQLPPTTCSAGQLLAFDGTDWVCANRTPPGTTTFGGVTFKCSEGAPGFEDRGAWCYTDGGHVCTVDELNTMNRGGTFAPGGPTCGAGTAGHAWTEHAVAGFNEPMAGNLGSASAWIWRSDSTMHSGSARLGEGYGVYCCY